MIAVLVVTSTFLAVVAITWLTARAEAAQTRCDDLTRHIHDQLDIPPTDLGAPPPPRRRVTR